MDRNRFSSIFVVLALLLTASLASAATSPRLEMLTKELGLTAEQREKIGPLLKRQQDARKRVMENAAGAQDGAQLKATADAMAKRFDAQIEGVLEGDQVAKYKAMREKEMGGGATAATAAAGSPVSAAAKAGPRNMRLEKLTKELDLTAEQQAKIGPIVKRKNAAKKKVMENAAGAESGEQLKAKVDQISRSFEARIEGQLNGEQKEKYRALLESERQ